MTDNSDRKPALSDEVTQSTPWHFYVVSMFLIFILVGFTLAAFQNTEIKTISGLKSCEITLRDGENGKFNMVWKVDTNSEYDIKGRFVLDTYYAERMQVLYNDRYLATLLFENIIADTSNSGMYPLSDSIATIYVGVIITKHVDLIRSMDLAIFAK